MNLKRDAIATVAGGFAMWVVAGLWHNLIAPQLYTDRHADHEGIGLLLVAYLVLSGLMTQLYRRRAAPPARPLVDGLLFGAVIGVLWVFPHELAMAGAHGEPLAYVFKNGAWHAIEQSVGGLVIGLVFARTWRSTSP